MADHQNFPWDSDDDNLATPAEVDYGQVFPSCSDPRCMEANRRLIECNGQIGWLGECSSTPEGLNLQITPSLLKDIQGEVNKYFHLTAASRGAPASSNSSQFSSPPSEVSDLGPNQKSKAGCRNALIIRIGKWELKSFLPNDVMAKIYFVKKRMMWEIMSPSRKKLKIEMHWSDIIGIEVTEQETELVLQVELAKPPNFHEEMEPEPLKHTRWKQTSDFTGGEASTNRIHLLMFSLGEIDKEIEKLFKCEPRLLELSRRKFPTFSSPYFDKPNHMPISFCLPGFGEGFQNSGFQQHSFRGPNPPMLVPLYGSELDRPNTTNLSQSPMAGLTSVNSLPARNVNAATVPWSTSYADSSTLGQALGINITSNVAPSSSVQPSLRIQEAEEGNHGNRTSVNSSCLVSLEQTSPFNESELNTPDAMKLNQNSTLRFTSNNSLPDTAFGFPSVATNENVTLDSWSTSSMDGSTGGQALDTDFELPSVATNENVTLDSWSTRYMDGSTGGQALDPTFKFSSTAINENATTVPGSTSYADSSTSRQAHNITFKFSLTATNENATTDPRSTSYTDSSTSRQARGTTSELPSMTTNENATTDTWSTRYADSLTLGQAHGTTITSDEAPSPTVHQPPLTRHQAEDGSHGNRDGRTPRTLNQYLINCLSSWSGLLGFAMNETPPGGQPCIRPKCNCHVCSNA